MSCEWLLLYGFWFTLGILRMDRQGYDQRNVVLIKNETVVLSGTSINSIQTTESLIKMTVICISLRCGENEEVWDKADTISSDNKLINGRYLLWFLNTL